MYTYVKKNTQNIKSKPSFLYKRARGISNITDTWYLYYNLLDNLKGRR